jgi:hypothetical protein
MTTIAANRVFPAELYESDDFGDFALICSPEQFQAELSSFRVDFGSDFEAYYKVWDLIDLESGLYEKTECRTSDGKNHVSTVRALVTWNENFGTYKMEEV